MNTETFLNHLTTKLARFGCDPLEIDRISGKIKSRTPEHIGTEKVMNDLIVQVLSSECHRFSRFDSIAVSFLDDEHKKSSPASFLKAVEKIQNNRDINGVVRPLLSDEFHRFILTHATQVEELFFDVLQTSEHFPLSTFGWKTLYRSYLIRTHEGVIERPDHLWYRVALFLHRHQWSKVRDCFQGLREGRFIHATPTLFSAGMVRPQMASCFSENSLVLTNTGYQRIVDIELGTMVLTHKNRWRPVVQRHKNPRGLRSMFVVQFEGKEPIEATDDHPFYIYDKQSSGFMWKHLFQLYPGDLVADSEPLDPVPQYNKHIVRGLLYGATFYGYLSFTTISFHEKHLKEIEYLISTLGLPFRIHTYPCHKIEIQDADAIHEYQSPASLVEIYATQDTIAWEHFLYGISMTKIKNQGWYIFPSVNQISEILEVCRIKQIKCEEDNCGRLRIKTSPSSCCGCLGTHVRRIAGGRVVSRLVSKRILHNPPNTVYTLGVQEDHSYIVQGVVAKNCFLVGSEDSVHGIFQTLADCAQISKWAGGLGIHISSIRGQNSYIYGTNGTSNGILPMLKVYNDTARYIDQCFDGKTMVVTMRGLIPIEDIEPMKDRVLTKSGSFEIVLNKLTYIKDPESLVQVTVQTPWGSTDRVIMTKEHTIQWKRPNEDYDMIPLNEAREGWMTMYAPVTTLCKSRFSEEECFVLGYLYRHLRREASVYVAPVLMNHKDKSFPRVMDFLETYFTHRYSIEDAMISIHPSPIARPEPIDYHRLGSFPEEFRFIDPWSKSKAFYEGWNFGEQYPKPDFWKEYREKTPHYGEIKLVESFQGSSSRFVYDLEVDKDPSYQTSLGIVHNGGGKRNGAFAIYLEPWHADIFAFLEAKKNVGPEEERARDLFYALWIPDLFMKCVEKGDDWYLMSPNQCPLLPSVWGKDFETMYKMYIEEGKYIRKVPAREVWREILRSQIETGTPYMLYKDTCNRKSNQQNLGTIRSSNLCCEIIEYSDDKEYAVCNLASISLPSCVWMRPFSKTLWVFGREDCVYCQLLKGFLKERQIMYVYHTDVDKLTTEEMERVIPGRTLPIVYVDEEYVGGFQEVWQEYLKPEFDFDRLSETTRQVVENLNIVIDKNAYPLDKCKVSNFKHRPIGIGVQGLADVFFQFLIAYDSIEARRLNQQIFETIYYSALQTSNKLAKRDGFYSTYPGSPISKGIFHFEMDPSLPIPPLTKDWEGLREMILRHGVRNSLLVAPMPTASTSQILGNTESFEPLTSNLYLRRTSAGEFYVCNGMLRKLLDWMHLWNNDTIENLIIFKGSVQKLSIPVSLKSVFRTVWEIPQKALIDMAADRQMFIDQSQSFNIYLQDPDMEKLTKIHFYGWKKGLKTGSYYVRSRSSLSSQNFTIDPLKEKEKLCESCSA